MTIRRVAQITNHKSHRHPRVIADALVEKNNDLAFDIINVGLRNFEMYNHNRNNTLQRRLIEYTLFPRRWSTKRALRMPYGICSLQHKELTQRGPWLGEASMASQAHLH